MNLTNIVAMARTADLTMAERGMTAAKVVLTGFVVVFAVLILLIFIIKIYGGIVTKIQQGGKKKKVMEKEKQELKSVNVKPVSVAPTPAVQDGVSEEVVAVISAAVATMYGSPEKARIKSIKKAGGGRSAWANAGVLDNTRPF